MFSQLSSNYGKRARTDTEEGQQIILARRNVSSFIEQDLSLQADHQYYNVSMTNQSNVSTAIAKFTDNRSAPILDNASNYHLAIVRFSAPTTNIPYFLFDQTTTIITGDLTLGSNIVTNIPIPVDLSKIAPGAWIQSIVPGQISNPPKVYIQRYDATLRTIRMSHPALATVANAALSYTQSPYIVSINDQDPANPSVFTTCLYQDVYNRTVDSQAGTLGSFRYIYSYRHMLDIVNTALFDMFTIFKATAAGIIFPPTHAPFITFEPSNYAGSSGSGGGTAGGTGPCSSLIDGGFILHADSAQTPTNGWFPQVRESNPGSVQLYMTKVLYNLFNGLPASIVEPVDSDYFYPNEVILSIYNVGNNAASIAMDPQGAGPYNAWDMVQLTPSLHAWCHFESMIFTTTLTPVQPEIFNSQTSLETIERIQAVAPFFEPIFIPPPENDRPGLSVSKPLITDFEIQLDEKGFNKTPINYRPTSEYRLVSLNSTLPLKQFDVQVFWKDRFNNFFPVLLRPKETITIKYLFRRKHSI